MSMIWVCEFGRHYLVDDLCLSWESLPRIQTKQPLVFPSQTLKRSKIKMRFSIILTTVVYAATCSLIAASPAPAPTAILPHPPPPLHVSCTTVTVPLPGPAICPALECEPICFDCAPCTILGTSTLPCPPARCTRTVSVEGACPTACFGPICETKYVETVTASNC